MNSVWAPLHAWGVERASPAPVSTRATWWSVAGLVAVAGVHATGVFGELLYPVVLTLAIVIGLVGIRRNQPTKIAPWRLIALASMLWLVAGVASEFYQTSSDLSAGRSLLPDVFAVPAYLLFGAGLLGFSRARGDRSADRVMDGMLIAAASALVVYETLIAPTLNQPDTWIVARLAVSVYPALSICIMMLAARLSFGGGRTPSLTLVLASTVGLFTGDMLYAASEIGATSIPGGLIDLPYTLTAVCLGASLLHPSSTLITTPIELPTGVQRRRLLAVGIAMMMPVVIMAMHRRGPAPLVVIVIAAALAATAIARVADAARQQMNLSTELYHRATHDDLTALPTRRLLLDTVERMMTTNADVAVLFMDLDHFKFVNDSMGHAAGDEVLRRVADRLKAVAPSGSIVSRQSGDEFVVVVPGCDATSALDLAARVRRTLRLPYMVDEGEAFIAASIGVTNSKQRRVSASQLLQEADTAMYRAKETGRDGVTTYDDSMHTNIARRIELERALRQAIAGDEITVAFQPIVDHQRGRITGFEALARWNGRDGSVSPSEFVPIAEDSGLIVALGAFVLDEACRQAAWWRRTVPGGDDMYVSVNVSPRQLRSHDFVDTVADVLLRHGLAGEHLWLEITERVLIEDSIGTLAILNGLRSLGVRLAIDDFGTGYSSLSYLKRFPVDRVKIDRSFVAGLALDASSTSLVRAIVAMAEALDLEPVAEGVENRLQVETLARLGCTSMQGFLLGRPMSPHDAAAEIERVNGQRADAQSPIECERTRIRS